jgi:hypothetical protein
MIRRRLFAIRKYKKGDPITSLDELMKQEFIYYRHKITHKGWFMSWPLRSVENYISAGRLFKAVKVVGNE